jgi:hypothetical protein
MKSKRDNANKVKMMTRIINESYYKEALNNLAIEKDVEERFGGYKKDTSVGMMYQ